MATSVDSQRYRNAARVDNRHEVQLDDGGWVRVRSALTLGFRSGRRIRMLYLEGDQKAEISLPEEVMSRLATTVG